MECPDCGREMIVVSQNVTGNDSFHIIETQWFCPFCESESENETGHDERN